MSEKKILLVTGASSDVGSQLIRKIGGNYSRVWAQYNKTKNIVDELCDEMGAVISPIYADFLDRASIDFLIDTIKDTGEFPDHVVHLSAFRVDNMQFHKISWENYQKEIDISLKAIMLILRAIIPEMVKKRYGKIVFMLTSYLFSKDQKFQSPYITVKSALHGFMDSLATEYGSRGIRVNAVSPNMIATKFLAGIPELIIEQNAKNSFLGRNLCVDDVIPTFEYLLSSASDAVNGQNIGIGV